MAYEITKEFHFSASHQLSHLPDGHQCARLHGHNYVVVIHLASKTLNKDDFVQDYGELKPIKTFIDEKLDHRHLDDVMPYRSTAENLARWIYKTFKPQYQNTLSAVSVSETPKTWATYIGDE